MLITLYLVTWHHVPDVCKLDTHNGKKLEFNLCKYYLQTSIPSTELACYELVYSGESNSSSQAFIYSEAHCN